MVKVGFIVEGMSDKILLGQSKNLQYLFNKYNIEVKNDFIRNARNKARLKENFVSFYNSLMKQNVDFIFILIDQDDKEQQKKHRKYSPLDCPIIAVEEIQRFRDNKNHIADNQIYVVMTREIEAWYLADKNLQFAYKGSPEEIHNPSDLVASQLGTNSHIKIVNRLKDKFSLERAAKNAPSARRFLNKLKQISNKNEAD